MKSASSQSLTKSDLQTVKKTNLTSLSSTLTTKSSDQKLELSALKNKEKTSNVHHKNSLEEKNTSNLSLPQVLIYHSHNRESWIPELKNIKVANEAFDSKTNVTLLGDYLIKKNENI